MSTRDLMHEGLRRARSNGHRVTGWTPDVDDGYLTECAACGLFMAVVDPLSRIAGEPPITGALIRRRCSGRRMA